MNIVLGIISIIFVYTSTILMDKFLKKEGLIIWITFATITANILVCKNIDIFNLTVSLGNIMFACIDVLMSQIQDREVTFKLYKYHDHEKRLQRHGDHEHRGVRTNAAVLGI